MKEKMEILIEEEVVALANSRAVEEHRPMSDLIEDALVSYLRRKAPDRKKREAYKTFCEQAIQMSPAEFEELLKEDTWGR